jgi:hypothetical protein
MGHRKLVMQWIVANSITSAVTIHSSPSVSSPVHQVAQGLVKLQHHANFEQQATSVTT